MIQKGKPIKMLNPTLKDSQSNVLNIYTTAQTRNGKFLIQGEFENPNKNKRNAHLVINDIINGTIVGKPASLNLLQLSLYTSFCFRVNYNFGRVNKDFPDFGFIFL